MEYKIIEELGILSETAKGWQKLLTKVKWGDNDVKYDIRSWSEDRTKCSKGITLNEEEAIALLQALEDCNIG